MLLGNIHPQHVESAFWVLFAIYAARLEARCAPVFFVVSFLLRLCLATWRPLPARPAPLLIRLVPTVLIAYIWLTLTPAQLVMPTPMDVWAPYRVHPPLRNFEELYRPQGQITVE